MRKTLTFVVVAFVCWGSRNVGGLNQAAGQELDREPPPVAARWVPTTPLKFDQIPDETRALSAQLLEMEPEAAADKLIEAWKKADGQIGTVQVERFAANFGQYDNYARWRRMREKGCTLEKGSSAEDVRLQNWVDWQRGLAVTNYNGSVFATWDNRAGFCPWGASAQIMAFPHRRLTYNRSELFEFEREGTVLMVARRHGDVSRIWVDLNSLAVLRVVYECKDFYLVRQPVDQRYFEGFPFPVPSLFVESQYRSREDGEPLSTRHIKLAVTISDNPDQEYTFPPLPTLTIPGEHRGGHWAYEIKEQPRDKEQGYAQSQLIGTLKCRRSRPREPRPPADPVAGDTVKTFWGTMQWFETDHRLGWFLAADEQFRKLIR